MAVHPQQYVVVWECSSQPNSVRWNAYSPVVSQVLEKAFRSKLTQVLLGDADPSLSRFRYVLSSVFYSEISLLYRVSYFCRVSLTSMTQICEVREEACPVRRMLYPRSCPAGQGIRWDWLGDRFSEWIEYSMDAQNAIEAAWSSVIEIEDQFQNHIKMSHSFFLMHQYLGTSNIRSFKDLLKHALHYQLLQFDSSEERYWFR